MSFERLFLVRHGAYDRNGLTIEGAQQSRRAGETLSKLLDGSPVKVLSSNATRAVLTSEIISEHISRGEIYESEIIKLLGENEKGIEKLEPWIEKAMAEVNLAWADDLVVVSHKPLLDTVKYGRLQFAGGVANGEIVQFNPDEWHNENWDPAYTFLLESMLSKEVS